LKLQLSLLLGRRNDNKEVLVLSQCGLSEAPWLEAWRGLQGFCRQQHIP